MEREKKPEEHSLVSIVNYTGRAFGIGAIGGSAYHFIKGTYNSPVGARFVGGAQAMTMNAPRLGGTFAVFGGLFSTFEHTLVYMRNKEDPWNSVIAGAATGGLLSIRRGFAAASTQALLLGVLMTLFQGPSKESTDV